MEDDIKDRPIIWKPLDILNLPRYEVSNTGIVRNKKSKYILKIGKDSNGYSTVSLQVGEKERKSKELLLHRLVAIGHIEQDNKDAQTVDHIDQDKSNNNKENLRWATHKEQAKNRPKAKKGCNARSIIQKNLDGTIINIFKTTIEATTKLQMHSLTIKKYALNNTGRNGYTLHYVEDKKEDNELWIELKTTAGTIEISNKGRRKMENGRLSYGNKMNGYLSTRINNKSFYLHRLIAQAFCDGFQEGKVVNHKDHNKTNNKADNLEWCTLKENSQHASEHGKLNKYRQRIAKCDDDMNIIEVYPSIAHVARLYDTKYDGDIHKAIREHYRFRGFYWKKINNTSQ